MITRAVARSLSGHLPGEYRDGRHLVTTMMVAVALVVAFWTGVAWAWRAGELAVNEVKAGVSAILHSENLYGGATLSKARSPQAPTPPRLGAESAASTAASTQTAAAPDFTLANLCPTPLVSGTPSVIVATITELFLGGPGLAGGQAPGTSIAGCPGKLRVRHTLEGTLAYTLGVSPATGETLSVAVDSPLGSGLFLAPAVHPVLRLLNRFGVVGGMRRFAAGTGDLYPVQTPAGTYILIRRETGTGEAGNAYSLIPPVVGQAWATSIAASHKFLWPVLHREGDRTVYDFDSNTEPSSVSYVFPYSPSAEPEREPELSEKELATAASLAGYHPGG